MIRKLIETLLSVRLSPGLRWRKFYGSHWHTAGLLNLTFTIPGERFDYFFSLHLIYVQRQHWQWGYDEDWYDGPLPSFGVGPFFRVDWMQDWPFPPRGFEPGEQMIGFPGFDPCSYKCPRCQGVSTITKSFVYDLIKSDECRGLVFCCHCRDWVRDAFWMRNGIETDERVGEPVQPVV